MKKSRNGAMAESRLVRYMKAPLRMLIHARDFYIRSLTSCAGRVQHAEAMGYGPVMTAAIPRSYSGHSSQLDQDLRELIRAASVAEGRASKSGGSSPAVGVVVVPRSQSVAVGRIDEDKPYDFSGDEVKVGADLLIPRSRSYAVGPKRGRLTFV